MDIQYVEFAAELFFKMCREHPEICPHDYHWITKKDNVRKGRNKPILQFDLDGNLIREWDCASDVGKEARHNINKCLTGKTKSAYGYFWKFKE